MAQRPSILDGIDVATLQTRLAAMQLDYLDLMSGRKTQSASYSHGDGSQSVSYTITNIGDLTAAILTMQTQIDRLSGLRINRRAPMTPVWRR